MDFLGEAKPTESKDIVNVLEAIYPGEDSPEYGNQEWSYTLNALIHSYQCVRGDRSRALAALDAAYMSVSESELNRAAWEHGGLAGREIMEAEAASAQCCDEIEFQLSCLHRLEAGQALGPKDVGG